MGWLEQIDAEELLKSIEAMAETKKCTAAQLSLAWLHGRDWLPESKSFAKGLMRIYKKPRPFNHLFMAYPTKKFKEFSTIPW